jgi:hypothetical protein
VQSLGKVITKRGAHDTENLESQDVHNDEDGERHDGANLDVQLDQAATSLPVEAAPGIEEADTASSAEQLANDLAAKGAVKRNDGILLLGQEGCLDTDLGDCGGDAEEEGGEGGEHDSGEATDGKAGPLAAGVLVEVLRVDLVQTEQNGDAGRQVQADVGHGGGDGGSRGKRLPGRLAGDALPEGGLGGHGDDLVSPCGVEVGNGGAGKTADDDGLAGEAAEGGEEAAEELDGKGEGQGVECVDLETPEASPLASVGDEVLDSTADAGGDGLLADEGDGGTGLEEGLLLALGCGLLRRGDCDSGVRGLDHAQGGDDFLEHVVELQRRG